MSESLTITLRALRDVEGVLGSYLIDADGELLARDIPVLFDPESLARASVHLSRLRLALESAGGEFEGCVTRFGPHVLLLRAARDHTLVVLCPRGTNLPAVQMSSTLIVRRLLALLPKPVSTTRLDSELPGSSQARSFRGRPL
jgi:predicted regulator of Ras-like GTPase activity (Roadblock/LC7/MglB family)